MAAMDIDSLLSKTPEISKGIIYNIHQSLLKDWRPESLPEDTIQQLLTGNFIPFFNHSVPLHLSYHLGYFCLTNFCFYLLQGLNLLELASHLERKAAQLCHKGLGRIKVALAGPDTSSLLGILEGSFSQVDLDTTTSSTSTEIITTKKQLEEPLDKTSKNSSVPPSEESSLATAELVFPMKSIPLVTASLPESLLPFHGPETLSCYRCQYPSCTHVFSQKAAACNHVPP